MQSSAEEGRRLTLLRHLIQAWRTGRDDRFLWVFQMHWTALPREGALAVAREIVSVTLEQPDRQIAATYNAEGTVRITSSRENALFQILQVPLAESLIAAHQQLAAAASRFPNGIESVIEDAKRRQSSASGASCGGGQIMGGRPSDFPYLNAPFQASQDGDFGPPIEHAIERYRRDVAPESPNQVAREFWPSTCSFRSILYSAGKRLGAEAAVYLGRISDADLRLFAQIELVAALAGLPDFPDIVREYRPPRGEYRASIGVAEPATDDEKKSGADPPGSPTLSQM